MPETKQKPRVPHQRYNHTSKAVYNSQHDVASAWVNGQYPSEDMKGAVVRNSSSNFLGRQRADGSGVLRHYRTIEAIRTLNGLIISNSQCWARGFAHCTTPPNTDYSAPLTSIRQELDSDHRLRDIVSVDVEGSDMIFHIDGAEYVIYVGTDSSILDTANQIMIRLESGNTALKPSEVTRKLLTPQEVSESDYDVVASDEYTKSTFRDPTDEQVNVEGLEVRERYGTRYGYNHKRYRPSMMGNSIIRHGEWFFIPRKDFSKSDYEDGGRTARKKLGNHHVQREDGIAMDSDGKIYVRGMITHANGDHNAVHLGDIWHLAVTHDREVSVLPDAATTRRRVD